MKIINITEAKAQLSALIEQVSDGQEVIIGKAGKPMARLVRYEQSSPPRARGSLQSALEVPDEFDDLPQDLERGLGWLDE